MRQDCRKKKKHFFKTILSKTKRPRVIFYEAVLTLEFEHGFCKKKFMIKKKIIKQYYCLFSGYNSGSC